MNALTQALKLQRLNLQEQPPLPRHPGTGTLPAPIIPSILIKGGLNKGDLHDPHLPVVVQVIIAPFMEQGDTLDLYINDVAVATETITAEQLQIGAVTFRVLPEKFPDRDDTEVHYHHTTPVGGNLSSSLINGPFPVKTTVPGNPDPDPTTPYDNENLLAPTGIPSVVDTSRPLVVGIPRYAHLAAGDIITLHWAGVRIERAPLTDQEAGNPALPLTVEVPAAVLAANPGARLVVVYDVYDKVKNWSLFSLKAFTDAVGAGIFPPPIVGQAPSGVLDIDALNGADVDIMVLVYPHFPQPGTAFTVVWRGQPPFGPAVEFRLPGVTADRFAPAHLTLDNARAAALAGSTATVYFEAQVDENGAPSPTLRTSERLSLSVVGTPKSLELPQLTGVAGPVYDPDQIVGSYQEVIVPAWGFMAVGQSVTVYWDGLTATGSAVSDQKTVLIDRPAQVGRSLSVYIEKLFATVLKGGGLEVSYTVTAAGQSYASPVLALTVGGIKTDLPAPTTVPDFPGGDLDLGQVGNFITVNIAANAFFEPGDIIVLHSTGSGGVNYTTQLNYPGSLSSQLGKTPYLDGNLDGLVTLGYQVRRNGVLVGSSTELTLAIRQSGGLPWPLPAVQDATGTTVSTLQPIKPGTANEPNTATVLISDPRILAGDTVAVTWLIEQADQVVPWVLATAGAAHVPVPDAIVTGSMGKTAVINYTVYRGVFPNLTLVGTSLPIDLPVLQLPASALPTPVFEPLTGGRLDLNFFAGDGVVVVPAWPRIAQGQTVWMTVAGTDDRNEPWLERLYVAKEVTAAEVSAGLRRALPRAQLLRMQNATTLTVQTTVNFDNSLIEGSSTGFPEGAVIMTQTTLKLPAPIAPDIVNGELDVSALEGRALAVTGNYETDPPGQSTNGHVVTMTLTTAPSEIAWTEIRTQPASLIFNIPNNLLSPIGNSAASLSFSVKRTANAIAETSRERPFTLKSNGGPGPGETLREGFDSASPIRVNLPDKTVIKFPSLTFTCIGASVFFSNESFPPFIQGLAIVLAASGIVELKLDTPAKKVQIGVGLYYNNYHGSISFLDENKHLLEAIPTTTTKYVEYENPDQKKIAYLMLHGHTVRYDNVTMFY